MPPANRDQSPYWPNEYKFTRRCSILEIIINRWALAFGHAFLFLIHFSDHPASSCLLGLFVVSQLDKARESQTDTLPISTRKLVGCRFVSWTKRQICRLDLPNKPRFKPDVWLVLVASGVMIKWFWAINDMLLQLGMEVL